MLAGEPLSVFRRHLKTVTDIHPAMCATPSMLPFRGHSRREHNGQKRTRCTYPTSRPHRVTSRSRPRVTSLNITSKTKATNLLLIHRRPQRSLRSSFLQRIQLVRHNNDSLRSIRYTSRGCFGFLCAHRRRGRYRVALLVHAHSVFYISFDTPLLRPRTSSPSCGGRLVGPRGV